MLTPPRSRPSLLIHHPMTGQQFRPRRISERPPHHSGMTGPPRQGRHIAVRGHLPAGDLANDAQHIGLKLPSLLHRHSIQIILHLSKEYQRGQTPMVPFFQKMIPLGSDPFGIVSTQHLFCRILSIYFLNDAFQDPVLREDESPTQST